MPVLTGWKLALGVTLVLASVVVYSAQLIIFGRTGDTFYYMLQDLAFVPVQALLVTLVLDQLFKRREKMALRQKMNMVIGAFFSEAGTRLLKSFSSFDAGAGEINGRLRLGAEWTAKDFISARSAVQAHGFGVDTQRGDLPALKGFLH
ncbi:MAG TPA: hypothetical protein VJM83_03900, partial [Nitrospirota bacterium]|nr:hypothetical protein [Nitrospirota bacterium]